VSLGLRFDDGRDGSHTDRRQGAHPQNTQQRLAANGRFSTNVEETASQFSS